MIFPRVGLIIHLLLALAYLSTAKAEEIVYPKDSIGYLTEELRIYLSQPGVRKIIIAPTPPVTEFGITAIGPQVELFDTFEVENNEDGCSFKFRQFANLPVPNAAGKTKHLGFEATNIRPTDFASVKYVYRESLLPGLPESHVAAVEMTSAYSATSWHPDEEKHESMWLAIGFERKQDTDYVISMLERMHERAIFEQRVEKDLPEFSTFAERSELYTELDERLKKQRTNIGFFGAAARN